MVLKTNATVMKFYNTLNYKSYLGMITKL